MWITSLNKFAGAAYRPPTLVAPLSISASWRYNKPPFEWQMDAGEGLEYWPKRHCPASSARVVSHWFPNASLNIYVVWLVYVIVNFMTYTVARNGHWLNRSHNAGGSPALLQQEREGGIISGEIKMICPGHRSGWCSDRSLAAALPIDVCDWKHIR